MDECLFWLEKANERAEDYIELSYTQAFYEADDSDTNKANDKTEKDTNTFIGNAARAVIKMIENLISSIRIWIKKHFSIKHINDVRTAIKNAGKENESVKVIDSKKVNAVYSEAIKKVEEEQKKAVQEAESMSESNTDEADTGVDDSGNFITGIENMLSEKLQGLGKDLGDVAKVAPAWTTTLVADVALKNAINDEGTAEAYLRILESDKKLMEKLEQQLGKAQAKKFKKQIKSCTKAISLTRFAAKLRGECFNCEADIISTTIDDVSKIVSAPVSGAVGDFVKGNNITQDGKDRTRRAYLRSKLASNPQTKKGVKGLVKGANSARKAYNSAKFYGDGEGKITAGNLFKSMLGDNE
jgi:hypothetical protein